MSTNATSIRDAAYTIACAVPPAGADAWTLTRRALMPTLNSAQLPALTVALLKQTYTPDGDANVGPIKFMVEAVIGIIIVRAFDDPLILDGQADQDLDHILDALLENNAFTNRNVTNDPAQTASPFDFEAITRIENQRRSFQSGESYMAELALLMTFQFRQFFSPPAPNWLEQVDITLGQPYAAAVGPALAVAELQEGEINYQCRGPAGGAHGQPVGPFIVTLEPGASFTGNQTIILSDDGAGGVFVPSYGSSGVGSVIIRPPTNAVTFSFTYAAAAAGPVSLVLMDGQSWNDPPPIAFLAT